MYLYLLLFLEVIIFLGTYLLSGQDLLAPASVACIMFVVSTAFAAPFAKAWGINIDLTTTMVICAGLLAFIVGQTSYIAFSNSLKRRADIGSENDSRESNTVDIQTGLLVFLVLLGIATIFFYMKELQRILGGNSSNLLSLGGLYRAMKVNSSSRKELEKVNVLLAQLIKIVDINGYIASFILLNNIISRKKYIIKNILLITIMGLSVMPGLMAGGRGGALQYACAVLIQLFIIWKLRAEWSNSIQWKYIMIGLFVVVLGIPIFYYSLRMLGRTMSVNMGIMEYTAKYIGSGICMFDEYIKDPTAPSKYLGEETFIGLYSFLRRLGLNVTVMDPYLEKRTGINSNIYTFFRRPYHDFGFLGMLCFCYLFIIFFSWMYYKKIKCNMSERNRSIWIILYSYMFYWLVAVPIENRTISYLDFSTIIRMLLIVAAFHFLTRVKRRGSELVVLK